jgi:hypothetical protein
MVQQHLAQVNISRMLAPLTSPVMKSFVDNLVPINTLAESSEGFIWRLKTDDGDATSIKFSDDPMMIVNMSVWKDLESLKAFMYKTIHAPAMRNRNEWFEKLSYPTTALWHVPIGHIPSIDEAKARLEHLRIHGETDFAFSFKAIFSALH